MTATSLPPFGRQQTGRIACDVDPIPGVLAFTTATGALRLRVLRTSAGRRSSFAIGASFSQMHSHPFSLGRHSGGERRRRGLPCPLPASLFVGAAR